MVTVTLIFVVPMGDLECRLEEMNFQFMKRNQDFRQMITSNALSEKIYIKKQFSYYSLDILHPPKPEKYLFYN